MKKYNHGNKKSILIGIIIPIIMFFVSMSATFAYFTATAKEANLNAEIAYLKINFSENNIFANTTPITESVKLLPGDTLTTQGTILNESTVPVYSIIGFKIFITKANSSKVETIKDTYYSCNGDNIVEIIKTGDTYTSAINLEKPNENKSNNCKRAYTLSHTFDFYEYGNEYKNATVTYSVKAYAIQVSQIENGSKATEILLSRFDTINQYQQVEYIESTGTQYIDTKYIPNQDTSVLIDYQLTEITPSFLFGTRDSINVNGFTFNVSSNTFTYTSFHNGPFYSSIVADLNRHVVYKNKNKIYLDKNLIITATKTTFTSSGSLNILATHHAGANGYLPTSTKLYGFSIYDNDILIKKFVPCYRTSDGEIGMLDIINNEFYTNSGTGEFLKGNNI